ncbi:MAG: hypothetical protein ACREFF_13665 [Candidatus Udaeobacter sp.]
MSPQTPGTTTPENKLKAGIFLEIADRQRHTSLRDGPTPDGRSLESGPPVVTKTRSPPSTANATSS